MIVNLRAQHEQQEDVLVCVDEALSRARLVAGRNCCAGLFIIVVFGWRGGCREGVCVGSDMCCLRFQNQIFPLE